MNISMAEEISQQNSDLEIIRHRVREIEKKCDEQRERELNRLPPGFYLDDTSLWYQEPKEDKDESPVVSGGMEAPAVYGDLSKPILIMESELDAMLTFKTIDGICCVIALGGAQKKPDLELHQHLKQSPRILLALDFDEGGMKGNLFWRSIYPQLLFWPVPEGKGPGDAIKLGLDLRSWVEAGLKAIKL